MLLKQHKTGTGFS